MRRLLAAALVLLFSYTLMAPAFWAGDDAMLPACCRRAGMHHCSMMSSLRDSAFHTSESRFTAPPCPRFPRSAIVSHATLSELDAARFYSGLILQQALIANNDRAYRILPASVHQKRGPPTVSI